MPRAPITSCATPSYLMLIVLPSAASNLLGYADGFDDACTKPVRRPTVRDRLHASSCSPTVYSPSSSDVSRTKRPGRRVA